MKPSRRSSARATVAAAGSDARSAKLAGNDSSASRPPWASVDRLGDARGHSTTAGVLMSAEQPPDPPASDADRPQVIADLHELVAALDRRVPQPDRAGEKAIARDSAGLK